MALKISRRGNVPPFMVMDILRTANDLQAAGKEVFHLELGQPSGGPPEAVLAAARAALAGPDLGYTEAFGLPALRRRIAAHYGEMYGIALEERRIAVTVGSSGAFLLGFLAAFDSGDRVALAAPNYPGYRNILLSLGIEPVMLPSGPQSAYQPTVALLEKAAAKGPLDGLIVSSPSNPTGAMLDEGALADLAAYCHRQGIRLVSDEIYHGITFGKAAHSAAGLADGALVINSFSKYFAMTGWRLGWLVMPEDLVRPIERLAQNLFISPPTLAQHAALAAFDCCDDLDRRVAVYRENRDILLAVLPAVGLDRLAPADGAFYLYGDVRHLTDDSEEFCHRLLTETGIALTPGTDFDPDRGRGFVRISYAGETAMIAAAAKKLGQWLAARPPAGRADGKAGEKDR